MKKSFFLIFILSASGCLSMEENNTNAVCPPAPKRKVAISRKARFGTPDSLTNLCLEAIREQMRSENKNETQFEANRNTLLTSLSETLVQKLALVAEHDKKEIPDFIKNYEETKEESPNTRLNKRIKLTEKCSKTPRKRLDF